MTLPKSINFDKTYTSNSCGTFKVTEYNGARDVIVRFESTGNKTKTTASQIRDGSVLDRMQRTCFGIGFIGNGSFGAESKVCGVLIYRRWYDMLRRCYDKNRTDRNMAYIDVEVCDEWHNFQRFAEWFSANYPKDGGSYQIDKDRLNRRVYSPDSCKFLTQKQNNETSFARVHAIKNPKGEVIYVYNMAEFCRENELSSGHMSSVMSGRRRSHKGWTKAD